MAKKQEQGWHYTFSTILAGVTLLFVLAYFVQSFIEIRKVKPVSVAIERIKGASAELPTKTIETNTTIKKEEIK